MKKEELPFYQVALDMFWEGALRHIDGYHTMGMACDRRWTVLGRWGRSGYEIGSWPHVIFFSRPLGQDIYEVVKYVERDVTKYRCPNKAVYHELVDLLAFLWWKQKNLEWVSGFSTVEQVPGTLLGPYEKEPTHVVLFWNEHDHHMHLLAGSTTEEKAHQKVCNLRDEPGIVAFVEPLSEIILSIDGTDIVHAALGPKDHKG